MRTMWETDIVTEAFERSFTPIPPDPIWKWAEKNVWLENKAAAESGPYRSAKTPATRRLQELIKDPRMFAVDYSDPQNPCWTVVRCFEFASKKSSQSGLSEAAMNGIRWRAKYRPCNTIYAIDTREEARNISERLKPTLEKLDGGDIFTGNDDDIGTLVMRMRAMDIWFLGSFSSGKFANKQAPLVIADEVDEYGKVKGDTTALRNLASRAKTAEDGLQISLSKPKRKHGPIYKAWDRGNKEEFCIRCPHCDYIQWISMFGDVVELPFDYDIVSEVTIDGLTAQLPEPLPLGELKARQTGRLVFEHCKTKIDTWDKLQIERETYYECGACKKIISEDEKHGLVNTAIWLPTAIGTPGVVTQHISDLYSFDSSSKWGRLALDFIDAKAESRIALQGFYNHRLGLEFSDEINKTTSDDIAKNIAGRGDDGLNPYHRGTCSFVPSVLLLGADVGGNYAKWVVVGVHKNQNDIAVIDWGEEIDPASVADIMTSDTWPVAKGGEPMRVAYGFIDGKFRKRDVFTACLSVGGFRLIPVSGLGAGAARNTKLYSYHHVPTYPRKFRQLSFNDREAKNEMYISCLKKQESRIFFPSDVEKFPEFVKELCAEELIEDARGEIVWNPHPPDNHYGDCVKNALTGLRFLTRRDGRREADSEAV